MTYFSSIFERTNEHGCFKTLRWMVRGSRSRRNLTLAGLGTDHGMHPILHAIWRMTFVATDMPLVATLAVTTWDGTGTQVKSINKRNKRVTLSTPDMQANYLRGQCNTLSWWRCNDPACCLGPSRAQSAACHGPKACLNSGRTRPRCRRASQRCKKQSH